MGRGKAAYLHEERDTVEQEHAKDNQGNHRVTNEYTNGGAGLREFSGVWAEDGILQVLRYLVRPVGASFSSLDKLDDVRLGARVITIIALTSGGECATAPSTTCQVSGN